MYSHLFGLAGQLEEGSREEIEAKIEGMAIIGRFLEAGSESVRSD
jgi:hypothetical protein